MVNEYKFVSFFLVYLLSGSAFAAVTQTNGAGSAVSNANAIANFENGQLLGNNAYSEGGMRFSSTNLTPNNNDCDAASCGGHPGFSGFSGNYMYGSGYANATPGYFTIATEGESFFTGLEFVIGNGQTLASETQNVYWSAYLDGTKVNDGNIAGIAAGQVIGFSDLAGFDELRYTDSLGTDAAPAFDSVRAQTAAPVPVPTAFWLFASAAFSWFRLARHKTN